MLGCAGIAGYCAGFDWAMGVPVVEPMRAAAAMAAETVLTAIE